MALGAGVTELVRHVIRVAHPFKIVLMATKALRGSAVELAICVARRTVHRDVCAQQWETGIVVIKGRGLPRGSVMALSARVRELGFDVVVSLLIIRLVA